MPKYTIEICGPHNESVVFSPARSRLRGRWEQSKIAYRGDKTDGMKALAQSVSIIPGCCISLDTDAKQGRTFDPLLETADGRAIFERISKVESQYRSEFGETKPWAACDYNLAHEQSGGVKTWLFYMASLIEQGLAVLVPGSARLPTCDDVRKLPGRRLRDPLNSGEQTGTGEERDEHLTRWTDVVEPDAALTTAGSKNQKSDKE